MHAAEEQLIAAALARGFLSAEQVAAGRREVASAPTADRAALIGWLWQRYLSDEQRDAMRREYEDELRALEQATVVHPRGAKYSSWAALHAPPQDARQRLGDFQLERLLGRGSAGSVYAAHCPRLGRVALKVLAETASPQEQARFRLEAGAAARLNHPNIVRVHEYAEVDGRACLAMELVTGESLEALLRREGARPLARVGELGRALAGALAHAHARKVFHRDVKPENVLLAPGRVPQLTDFGLARLTRSRLTRAGDILGSPAYMAPEQAQGDPEAIGPWTDVYGLGATLYHAATGRRPFRGAALAKLLRDVQEQAPPAPRSLRPEIPAAFEDLLLRCLAKAPAERYPSAEALREALADPGLAGPA